jgi:DNA transposition AAA+ family ATPase
MTALKNIAAPAETEACASNAKLRPASGWIHTPTGSRILSALAYAQHAPDIVLVAGNGGAGKTDAARFYAHTHECCCYVAMTSAASDVVPALSAICTALDARQPNSTAALYRTVVSHFLPQPSLIHSPLSLLIVDEAQCLNDAALDQLRAIHDETRTGLALIGNRDLFARLSRGHGGATLDALRDRIGKRLQLDGATVEDADAMLDAWGVSHIKTRKAITEASAKAGGLRLVAKTLRLAAMRAEATGRHLIEADVRAAWQELGNS